MSTPQEPEQPDPLAVAAALEVTLNRVATALDEAKTASEARDEALTEYGRGNRHRIWLAYGLVAFDIAMTVLVVFFAVLAHDASSQASQNRQASATSCASGNDQRQTLTQVFDHIFAAFRPATAETAAQKAEQAKRVQALEAYYHAKFKPRDCIAIYGVTPAPTPSPSSTGSG